MTDDLIARLESAEAEQQASLIMEVASLALHRGWISGQQYTRISTYVYVGASVDAALGLVPEGWRYEVADYGGKDDSPRACLWRNLYSEEFDVDTGDMLGANAATPALALCAASLRARREA